MENKVGDMMAGTLESSLFPDLVMLVDLSRFASE